MSIKNSLSGNEAVAYAIRQINPDVFPAFPITPSTEVPQYVSDYAANGLVDTEFVTVESEHSAMAACIGSQAAGARTMTATSSCGLALMYEMLHVASSSRMPIVMPVINRALTGPININADHSDSMGAREAGWIQLYSENNQEVYDNMIQAVRIAEHMDVQLPAMVCQDGFITSHAVENIELIEDGQVKDFVGTYQPEKNLLNKNKPIAMGPYDTANYYIEHKRQQAEGIIQAKKVIAQVAKDFEAMTGRKYGFVEEYKLEDAEAAIVIINSTAGTAKAAIDTLRNEGRKVGLLKIRVFNPFPVEEIINGLKDIKAVAVMDRAESLSGFGGPVFALTRSALFDTAVRPKIINYIYGLGGRDVTTDDIAFVYDQLFEIIDKNDAGEVYRYLGVRE